ncbi:MAG: 50S ribosomal protein L10 [Halobacteriaceae archaeon]
MAAESERRTEQIPQWKREEVDELVDLIESYDSVGVVSVTGIPNRQLQEMRHTLHGSAVLRMSRNTLLERALDEVDAGVEAVAEYVSGEVGLIATDDNPFRLYQRLEETKTPAPISAGEVAPNDVVIPEGDTGIDPGPFVGDLQSVGANARIEDGSIRVLEDSTVAEAGETVSADLAGVLAELGIEPKEVGLDLRAVYAEGVLFEAEELDIDVGAYRDDVAAAGTAARNLSVNAAYPTARTIGAILGRAAGDAKALGIAAAVEDPDVMPDLVSRADRQVRTLAASLPDEALPEELQDVEAPEPDDGDGGEDDAGEQADEAEEQTDQETEPDDADDDGDDDDDTDAGEGLGEMFG